MSESPAPGAQAGPPSLAKIFHVFFMIGLTSFGGGLVAYLKDEVVDKQRWLDDEDFLAALEIGQTLPGLNSTNVAVIVGRKLRGPRGAFMAALGLLLPGVVMLAVLGVLYMRFQHDPQVKAVLAGVAAAAVGLLAQVTLKIGAKQFLYWRDLIFIALTFYLVGILHVSLLAVLALVAPLAVWFYRPHPGAGAKSAPSAK